MQKPIVSVVTGTYNRLEFLQATIDTVRQELKSVPHETIVVDGGSDDGTIEWLTKQKDIIAIVQHNRGEWQGKPIERQSWGYFMNLGFRAASAKYICMLSDDCLVVPGAIKNGIQCLDEHLAAGEKIGALAFYWRNWPEQKKYWVGLTYENTMHVNHGMYVRAAMQAIDFIDADDYFFYHADSDICMRLAQADYKTIDSPASFIEHYSDANTEVRTTNMEHQQKDWATYTGRWGKLKAPKQDWIEVTFDDHALTAEKYWRKMLPKTTESEYRSKSKFNWKVWIKS